jgi:hypothetical protein
VGSSRCTRDSTCWGLRQQKRLAIFAPLGVCIPTARRMFWKTRQSLGSSHSAHLFHQSQAVIVFFWPVSRRTRPFSANDRHVESSARRVSTPIRRFQKFERGASWRVIRSAPARVLGSFMDTSSAALSRPVRRAVRTAWRLPTTRRSRCGGWPSRSPTREHRRGEPKFGEDAILRAQKLVRGGRSVAGLLCQSLLQQTVPVPCCSLLLHQSDLVLVLSSAAGRQSPHREGNMTWLHFPNMATLF